MWPSTVGSGGRNERVGGVRPADHHLYQDSMVARAASPGRRGSYGAGRNTLRASMESAMAVPIRIYRAGPHLRGSDRYLPYGGNSRKASLELAKPLQVARHKSRSCRACKVILDTARGTRYATESGR